jgi:hypothetical protein
MQKVPPILRLIPVIPRFKLSLPHCPSPFFFLLSQAGDYGLRRRDLQEERPKGGDAAQRGGERPDEGERHRRERRARRLVLGHRGRAHAVRVGPWDGAAQGPPIAFAQRKRSRVDSGCSRQRYRVGMMPPSRHIAI